MANTRAGLHERTDKLDPETLDRHRAIISLMEEPEAIDWYDQVCGSSDRRSLENDSCS